MTEQLTMLDTTFLELEQADDSAHMHIGAIMVFDPRPAAARRRSRRARAPAARLGALPRYTPAPLGHARRALAWPAWEGTTAFDLDAHVHHATLPAPGGEPSCATWLADFWSHRLDRRRPLWEMVLVEGLEDGRWALASKTHHCLVDGVGSVDVGHLLLDIAPDAPPPGRGVPPRRAGDDGRRRPLLADAGARSRAARAPAWAPRATRARRSSACGPLWS